MKRILLAGLMLCTAFSCTNDEDLYTPTVPFTILGSWKLISADVETPVDLNGDGTASTDLMTETGCLQNELMQFNADMATGLIISNSYLEITISGEFPENVEYSIECVQEAEESPFVYVQEGNVIVITTGEGDVIAGNLSQDQLLQFTIPNGQIYMDEDFNVILMEDLVLTYSKIN